jgi:hypothetical protein
MEPKAILYANTETQNASSVLQSTPMAASTHYQQSSQLPSPQVLTPNCPGSLTAITRGTNPLRKAPWHNNNPFVILPLTARVKKCAGCPYPFRDPLGPPFIGLVIQHKEKDYYPDKFGNLKVSNESNHDYHCQMACMFARHPYFQVWSLQLGRETVINSIQASELLHQFGLNL